MISATSGSVSMRDFSRSWERVSEWDGALWEEWWTGAYVLLGLGESMVAFWH